MVQYATIYSKRAALSTDFGLELFRRKFASRAQELLDKLGTYKSGPRKGKPRGYIHWKKCERGGWVREGALGYGHVQKPGSWGYELRADRDDQSEWIASADTC